MNSNYTLTMWSSTSIDLKNLDVVLEHEVIKPPEFEPTPYAFKTVENGKKTTIDSSSITPPGWLLLDHTLAVIWVLFSSNPSLQQLSIDDLKWAHEFLKNVRNEKGENPPDVKICLKEIQDRLITLYARLTSLKDEDFDEIAEAFGEKIMADPSSNCLGNYPLAPVLLQNQNDTRADTFSIFSSRSPSKTSIKTVVPALYSHYSSRDLMLEKTSSDESKRSSRRKRSAILGDFKQAIPTYEVGSKIFNEKPESVENGDVEKYLLSLLGDEKKLEKNLEPTSRKPSATLSLSEVISSQETINRTTKSEKKNSKKVHCFAEMRSLKFQKSMKLEEISGEEAAYSNLKAEIRRLTINPNVSKNEVLKFLHDWRSEQMDRLHSELKRLISIEEFMKSVIKVDDEMTSNNSSEDTKEKEST